jgi:hypothetical protein
MATGEDAELIGYLASAISQAVGAGVQVGVEAGLKSESGGFNIATLPAAAGVAARDPAHAAVDSLAALLLASIDARLCKRERQTAVVEAATYDILLDDDFVDVQYSYTGVVALTLKTASMTAKRAVTIVDGGVNAEANNITISTEGAEKIGSSDTYVINTDRGAVLLVGVPSKSKWLPIPLGNLVASD